MVLRQKWALYSVSNRPHFPFSLSFFIFLIGRNNLASNECPASSQSKLRCEVLTGVNLSDFCASFLCLSFILGSFHPLPLLSKIGVCPFRWTGAENIAPTGIRSLDRPGRSEPIYWLRYPGPQLHSLSHWKQMASKTNQLTMFSYLLFVVRRIRNPQSMYAKCTALNC
jgi:hypothetical protein